MGTVVDKLGTVERGATANIDDKRSVHISRCMDFALHRRTAMCKYHRTKHRPSWILLTLLFLLLLPWPMRSKKNKKMLSE
jgi:hypothetical protein